MVVPDLLVCIGREKRCAENRIANVSVAHHVFLREPSKLEESVTLRGKLRVSAAEGVREAVLAGLGFAIASEWMFSRELARGEVISVLGDWQLPTVPLWALSPTGRQPNAKVRSFVEFVSSRFGKTE